MKSWSRTVYRAALVGGAVMVLGILAMATSRVLVRYSESRERVRVSKCRLQLDALNCAVLGSKRIPRTLEDLRPIFSTGTVEFEPLLKDPWGNSIVYCASEDGLSFDLLSYGRDGRPGGDGFDRDLRPAEWGKPK